ncbi:hypothetical protein GCM10011611_31710 [Aliidongia dinghuensis]|uniref:Uncharacterized protein n=1 Tax=Aliidongia dinghuensis TaxID=1867774 RepID=A0A8J2YVV7_9PROT|nr:hypothetical protein [Aliidongia dinghuensis]GGF23262.1 hypothetical protein GCM10011611_31710 [Aliidongia dinghuensis]
MPLDLLSDPVRFTEELRVQYGDKREIGLFLLQGDRALSEMGLRLYISHDLRRLYQVNRRHLDSWAPLMPVFHPDKNDIQPQGAFMFELRNDAGEIVATQVSRLLDLAGTNLKTEMEQLRLFYRDPARQAGPAERIEVTAPKAPEITGRVALSGGLWYRPDWRGKGISRVMPRMTRTFAYTSWDTDYVISFVEQGPVDHGILNQYGLPGSEPWVKIRDSYKPETDLLLTWRHKPDIAADVAVYLADLNARRERLRDVPDTQKSPAEVRQGSSRRS